MKFVYTAFAFLISSFFSGSNLFGMKNSTELPQRINEKLSPYLTKKEKAIIISSVDQYAQLSKKPYISTPTEVTSILSYDQTKKTYASTETDFNTFFNTLETSILSYGQTKKTYVSTPPKETSILPYNPNILISSKKTYVPISAKENRIILYNPNTLIPSMILSRK